MRSETHLEQLFFTTILIETHTKSGGIGYGTGFIIDIKGDKFSDSFLVTNKHVVKDAKEGILKFHYGENGELKRSAGPRGYKLKVPDFEQYWIGPADPEIDVTIMSMSLILKQAGKAGVELFFKALPEEVFPTAEQLAALDAVEEIVFVGYPNGISDEANYLPIVRRGITASPLQMDYNGKPQFLVDASVFPGSSGSPVLIVNNGQYTERGGKIVLGKNRVHLLGIISSVYQAAAGAAKLKPGAAATVSSGYMQMIDLGIVFKSQLILDLARSLLK